MKKIAALLVAFSGMYPPSFAQQKIPTFELHFSANRPLKSNLDQTFYGGGFGANLVFRDEHKLSFKTGFETNFFHTWNQKVYLSHLSNKSNVHYKFFNLSVPLMLRLHVGERVKFFLEAGGYLGIPLAGNMTSKYHSTPFYQGQASINETRTEKFSGYFSVSPAISLGLIFPVSQHVDLFLKPEFLFQKNFGVQVYEPGGDFNEHFFYIRLCLGIRINWNDEIE